MAKKNEQKTILVIEDDKSLLVAIESKMQRNDFGVILARTVDQALGYLEASPRIDLIWLDHYLLGKKNGIDFVEKIKRDGSKWKSIPIFVVSNTVGPDKIQTYIRLGVVKYYVKAEKRLDDIISDIKICIQGLKTHN